jgi:quinol monooxygenase YgiN
MSEPIVFISHFKVKEGKLDELKQLSQKVTEHIKGDKPGTFTFLQYTNEEGTELSIIHIFPDAAAFDKHNEGAGERAGKAFEFIVPTRREIYGLPSDQAMAILTPPEDSEIILNRMPQLMGGYIRLKAD